MSLSGLTATTLFGRLLYTLRTTMNLLDRYLTRAIIAPTLAAFLVVAFIIVINEMKSQISRVLLPFLTGRDIAILGGALLPSVLPMILPAALFFGILMGYGRLA